MQYFKYAILQIENRKSAFSFSQLCIMNFQIFIFEISFFKFARYIPTKVEGGVYKI